MFYFDTSALLPYYRNEVASKAVQKFLGQQKNPVLVSYLTQVEVASALARWVRMDELSESQANKISVAFQEDVSDGRLQLGSLNKQHFTQATQWLLARKTSLRTLDALHLAYAVSAEASLVTLDIVLRQSAEFFGLPVVDIPIP